MLKKISLFLTAGILLLSCGGKTTPVNANDTTYKQASPSFNADSAYSFVNKQVSFGTRIPNSPQHKACGDYLVAKLNQFGAKVTEQKTIVDAYGGAKLNCRNIIGAYAPEKKDRILLFAHWDTRPWADQDPNPKNYHTPILGANDAGSGVGVLLEIARILQQQAPQIGVDIIFVDAEDYGTPEFDKKAQAADPEELTWCLGSRYWSLNPHTPNYKARFGILLDMVGGKNARFYKEVNSMKHASDIVGKIWGTASDLGYSAHFVNKQGGQLTDDHIPIIQNCGIPCVDIIQYDPLAPSGVFPAYWHTLKDDMSNVDKNSLKIVGQTVLEVVYKEK